MTQARVLVEVQFFGLLSGFIFFATKANPLAILPLLAYVAVRLIPLAQKIDYRLFVVFLVGLALFVDDISQVAWGREIVMPTEFMGKILFESIGINGLEFFTILLLAWIILHERSDRQLEWLQHGIIKLGLIVSLYFAASFISLLVGQMKGGDLNVHFIQSRFLHLLPMWTILGFMVIDSPKIASKVLNVAAVIMAIKGFQAVVTYVLVPASILDDEYLVDHYFSMYCALMIVYTLAVLYFRNQSLLLRSFLLLGLSPVFLSFILNQRRTSFVAFAFAIFLLPFFFRSEWLIRHFSKFLIAAVLLIGMVGVSWFLPPPFAFLKTTYESLQHERTMEDPAYRALENGNMFNAIGQDPILGLGTGQEFDEVFMMPDISFVYDRYRMIPHNLLLAAWAYGGLIGIVTLSLIFTFMISRSGTLLRQSTQPETIIFAVCAFFFLIQYIVYTYGDLGLQIPRNQMFAGLFFGGVVRLLARENYLSRSKDKVHP